MAETKHSMKIKDYRKKFSPVIETPGGLKVQIRPLRVQDFLGTGSIPDAFAMQPGEDEGTRKARVGKLVEEDQGRAVKFQKTLLLSCVTILDDEGNPAGITIVDKRREETAESDTEFSFEDFAPADTNFIVTEITKISNLTPEDAKKATPFPAQP